MIIIVMIIVTIIVTEVSRGRVYENAHHMMVYENMVIMRIARAQHGLENMVYENHARTNLNYNKLIIMREKKKSCASNAGA